MTHHQHLKHRRRVVEQPLETNGHLIQNAEGIVEQAGGGAVPRNTSHTWRRSYHASCAAFVISTTPASEQEVHDDELASGRIV